MLEKANVNPSSTVTNQFSLLLNNHFSGSKIKVQDYEIKIWVDQICTQDFLFLTNLHSECRGNISLNILRSGKGVSILIGVAHIFEVPKYLERYVRGEEVKKEDFKAVCQPVMDYLKGFHPHTSISINSIEAEMFEGTRLYKEEN